MQEFPFTKQEWQCVVEVSTALTNATLEDDDVLQASLFMELSEVLEELRNRHGDHPILLETQADFCDDRLLRQKMYRSAIRLAESNGLQTLTIRISLACVLLESFDNPTEAIRELNACAHELAAQADKWDIQKWHELMGKCKERESAK
jgi:predicted Zn-dependent protease